MFVIQWKRKKCRWLFRSLDVSLLLVLTGEQVVERSCKELALGAVKQGMQGAREVCQDKQRSHAEGLAVFPLLINVELEQDEDNIVRSIADDEAQDNDIYHP